MANLGADSLDLETDLTRRGWQLGGNQQINFSSTCARILPWMGVKIPNFSWIKRQTQRHLTPLASLSLSR